MMSPPPARKRASYLDKMPQKAEAGPSQIQMLADSGRKLASRSERIRRESLVVDNTEENDDSDKISDEQLHAVFHSYAKDVGTAGHPTLNVMQFSTIWRMITGERGNLFQEMKIFNQYVSLKQSLRIYAVLICNNLLVY